MEQVFRLSRNLSAKTGEPQFEVFDEAGQRPSAAVLRYLSQALLELSHETSDREQAARLEVGKSYVVEGRTGTRYLKFLGLDEKGLLVQYFEKDGTPRYGGLPMHYVGSTPVANFRPMADPPKLKLVRA